MDTHTARCKNCHDVGWYLDYGGGATSNLSASN
jgi:hypothetical protein